MSRGRAGVGVCLTTIPAVCIRITLAQAAPAPAANDPGAFCRAAGTDDTLQRLPVGLAAGAKKLFFAPATPDRVVLDTTVFRCRAGHVLVCATGADLPCGKADTSRTSGGASAWCAGHPDSAFVPMFATGHDTPWRWSCRGKQAVSSETGQRLDQRGFFLRYWKRIR